MNYSAEIKGNILIVKINGELDDFCAQNMRDKLDFILVRKDIKHIVFDLSSLNFMDSAGIGLVIGRFKTVRSRGGKGVIVCSNDYINRILKMSGVYKLFAQYDELDEAVESLSRKKVLI